jgi:hypothetical protein
MGKVSDRFDQERKIFRELMRADDTVAGYSVILPRQPHALYHYKDKDGTIKTRKVVLD